MFKRFGLATLSLSLAAGSSTLLFSASPAFADTLTDFAPQSQISTVTQGPMDSQFQQSELLYNAPLTSTSNWHGFLRQTGRDVTIKLPQTEAIRTISIDMKQNPGSGIYFPKQVDFEVYYGGQWYKAGTARSAYPISDKRKSVQTFTLKLNGVEAQQVRLRFPVGVWVHVNNLHVYGTHPGSGSTPPTGTFPTDGPLFQQPLSPTDARAHGIHNMLLAYTGDHGSQGTWTSSDFLPMVGYTPMFSTTATGPMFDTILFLPYGSLQDTQSNWQAYLQDLFTQGQQLSALDTAVAQKNQALGTSTKEKVVLTIPYPQFGDGQWGNGLDFNGTSTDPNAQSARYQAMQWYLQQVVSSWQSANFQNLELTGLDWESEQINYDHPGEAALIKDAVSLAHQDGLPLFWIPFYDAAGMGDWQSLGFDAAWLQPNFIEQGATADINRIRSAETRARALGMGVEIETGESVTDPMYQSLFSQTLSQLQTDGFAGQVSHAYYAGSKVLVTSANATDSSSRAFYDNAGGFISQP